MYFARSSAFKPAVVGFGGRVRELRSVKGRIKLMGTPLLAALTSFSVGATEWRAKGDTCWTDWKDRGVKEAIRLGIRANRTARIVFT